MSNRNAAILKSRIGLGTWKMGSDPTAHASEVAALKAGIDMDVTVLDTAEMYHDAELVTADAIAGKRDDLFIVTKVLPSNASFDGTIAACERSLKRLRIDTIDLYLLHWKGSHPLAGTVEAFETLRQRGLIQQWGVSNFDVADMEAVYALDGGENCAVNQVYYSMGERGIEYDLLPWQAERDVATMAYCPLDQGRLVNNSAIQPIADKHNATIAQIALAWSMIRPNVIPIPKSSSVSRTIENVNARNIVLDDTDLQQIDSLFAPPASKIPLKST